VREQSLEVDACDVSVGDPKHLKARALKESRAGRVVPPPRFCVVHVPIHLQHDPHLKTTKVHDESVQHMLTTKLEAEHTAIA